MFLGTFEKIDDFIEMFKRFNDDVKGLLLSILVSILYGLSTVLMEKYISTENDEINRKMNVLNLQKNHNHYCPIHSRKAYHCPISYEEKIQSHRQSWQKLNLKKSLCL